MPRRRGISPVIATVIIVAVTIAVAIAVAFWMTGIIGLFTGFEQLQITSIYDSSADGIVVTVKNTGTQTASIVDVFINGRSCKDRLGQCGLQFPITLSPGAQTTLKIKFSKTNAAAANLGGLGPGTSVEVKLLSATGKEYPKLLVLQEWSPQQ